MHHRLQVLCEYYIQYNSDAKYSFRPVNFPENKERFVLYYFFARDGVS